MRPNPSVDPPTVDPYVSQITSAECTFANSYTGYFPTKSITGTDYRIVPNGLVVYVLFSVELVEQRHKKVVIDLNGMKKPDSTDKGKSTDDSCYVVTGTTKANKEACAWTGTNSNK